MKLPFYNHILLCLVLACLLGDTFGQSYARYVKRADSLYKATDYKGSLKDYSKAFEIKSSEYRDLYNGACAAALAGADQVAIQWLKLSIDNGWTNINHLKSDQDLKSLHALPEWTTLVNDFQKKIDLIESKYDKALQKELLMILEADQSPRLAMMNLKHDSPGWKSKDDSLRRVIHRADSINLLKVTKILDERGWVDPDVVGSQASSTLFLVIQHADLETQVKYLPMVKDAVSRNALRPDALALLEDRIAIRQGRKQIYGSQIGTDDKTGKNYVLPLEDPKNVDVRRASVGLEPLSEYAKRFGIQWDPNSQESAK